MKNSIIAIESPEAEVDDDDFVDDLEEVTDVVHRYHAADEGAAAIHQPAAPGTGNKSSWCLRMTFC